MVLALHLTPSPLPHREYAGAKKKKFKPVVISHHMLAGLKEGQEKMSKSDPDSAIFMEGEWEVVVVVVVVLFVVIVVALG